MLLNSDLPLNIEQPAALRDYLNQLGYLRNGEKITMKVLQGGVSNRTVLVHKEDGTAWVIKQALEKLRVSSDWFSHPKRILKEARAMEWLVEYLPGGRIPSLVFLDKEQYILAMKAVPEPHDNFKQLLLSGSQPPDYFRQFGQLLGEIHVQGRESSTKTALAFADTSFFEALRLEPYYEFTAKKLPEVSDFLHDLCQACRTHPYTFVHGDYSPKNILVHRHQLILIDHEVAHFGDGTFDIGFALTHLLSKAHHLPQWRSDLIDGANLFWHTYVDLQSTFWTTKKETRAIAHTLACLLARVHGRSPLEYLTAREKDRQTRIAIALLKLNLTSIQELIHQFDQYLLND